MLDLLQEIAETYYPVKEEDHKDATLEDELSELKGQEDRRFFSYGYLYISSEIVNGFK